MSKLIEADKLIHNLKKWSDISPTIQRRNEDFIKILENEDAVKAVPVERLKQFRSEVMNINNIAIIQRLDRLIAESEVSE